MDYYIHQIGDMNSEKTYERLVNILKSKIVGSREYLEKIGIKVDYTNASFKLDILEWK